MPINEKQPVTVPCVPVTFGSVTYSNRRKNVLKWLDDGDYHAAVKRLIDLNHWARPFFSPEELTIIIEKCTLICRDILHHVTWWIDVTYQSPGNKREGSKVIPYWLERMEGLRGLLASNRV